MNNIISSTSLTGYCSESYKFENSDICSSYKPESICDGLKKIKNQTWGEKALELEAGRTTTFKTQAAIQ